LDDSGEGDYIVKLVGSSKGRRVNNTSRNRTTSNQNNVRSQSNAEGRTRYAPVEPRVNGSRNVNGNRTANVSRNTNNSRKIDNTRNDDNGNDNANRNQKRTVKKKRSGLKAALIVLLVIAILCAGAIVALGFYIDSLDTNFPNVWADGVDVSQLTIEETTQRLIDAGFEQNVAGIAATITFPDGTNFTVTGDEVGLSLNAAEAARNVFEFGRNDSLFENTITYVRSLFNRTDITELSTPSLDSSVIRNAADEYSIQFNARLLDNSLEIADDSITIVKGTGFGKADTEEVFDLALTTLLNAIEEHRHITVSYTPEVNSYDDIDINVIFEYIHIDVVAARFDIETRSVIESVQGRTFDLAKAEEMIANATNGTKIIIPIYHIEPEYTTQEIEALLFRDVLSESTTRMSNNANRIRNIQLTAEYINNTVLYPGDVFSFNEVVGQRTAARGFQEAGVIRNGRIVQGLGGGICQTSSTIYDAVLRTHLEVVERRNHGLTISYLPPGHDATVYWGHQDFKFRNNMDFPLRVESVVDGLEITVRLVGTRLDDYTIEIETVTLSTTQPQVEHRTVDDLAPGATRVFTPGQAGMRVERFQRVYNGDGELISRTSIGIDTYNVQQRVIEVGRQPTAPPPPEPPPELPPEPPPPEPPPEPPPPESES